MAKPYYIHNVSPVKLFIFELSFLSAYHWTLKNIKWPFVRISGGCLSFLERERGRERAHFVLFCHISPSWEFSTSECWFAQFLIHLLWINHSRDKLDSSSNPFFPCCIVFLTSTGCCIKSRKCIKCQIVSTFKTKPVPAAYPIPKGFL